MKIDYDACEYHPITGKFVTTSSWFPKHYQHFYDKLMKVEP